MQPSSFDVTSASSDDLARCRALLRQGSRTFFAASHLLPRRVRDPACALYAFCRLADDAVDLDRGADSVAQIQVRLQRAYAGHPLPLAADRAFAAVVARYAIPRTLPQALLEGFQWDAAGRRYEDLPALHEYAARVAGSVGAMMAILMGARSPDVVARACDLGVAMQLTNIARDVGEDARAGRLYLPLRWLREVGIDPDAWLQRPAFSPALGTVVGRLLDEADVLYQRAAGGIAHLPLSCRPGIHAARLLYARIGHAVERLGCDSVSRRAVVPLSQKAWLLGHAVLSASARRGHETAPVLEATRFLVDAVAAAPVPDWTRPSFDEAIARRSFAERVAWVIELFERLEQREVLERACTPQQAGGTMR